MKQVLTRRRTQSEAFFSSSAGQWDRLREDLFGPTSHLRALVGLLDPDLVIGDLGCGTGTVSQLLSPFCDRIIAVDASKEMLEAARENLAGQKHVELRQGSLEKLPIENGELDIALMMLVLHHLPEPKRVLAEAARAVKPAGRVLILDMLPHERDSYRQQMGHVWLGFSADKMTRLLVDAGNGEEPVAHADVDGVDEAAAGSLAHLEPDPHGGGQRGADVAGQGNCRRRRWFHGREPYRGPVLYVPPHQGYAAIEFRRGRGA